MDIVTAARDGLFDQVQLLCQSAPDSVNDASHMADGKTALHWAAAGCSVHIAELLLEAKAAVDAEDQLGLTPLNLAVDQNSLELAELLLTGAATDSVGQSNLPMAAEKKSIHMLELLIAAGAAVNGVNWDGATALHIAARFDLTDMAKVLLKASADVDSRDKHGLTPLHKAAQRSSVQVAHLLLAADASVDALDKREYTPLHRAASGRSLEMTELLLAAGSNAVDRKDADGNTPLELAQQTGKRGQLVAARLHDPESTMLNVRIIVSRSIS